MKKTYLFLVLLLGMFYSGTAQYRYTAAVWEDPNYGNLYKTPIRNWTKNYSVTYECDGTNYYVCLLDHSDFHNPPTTLPPACIIFRAVLPFNPNTVTVNVNDIYIVDDIAFFCGSYYNHTSGVTQSFWGYFKLMDFFSTNLNIISYVLQDLPPSGVAPKSLDRLVAYENGIGYDVVAYNRSSSPCCKVIEIQNALSSSPICRTYDLPVSNPLVPMCVDYIDDITISDTYVFLSGHDISDPLYDRIWYGIYRKTDFFNSMTSYNTYIFPKLERANGSVICTEITGDDNFALAYTYYDESTIEWYTRMRVIKASSGANAFSQQYQKEDKWEPLRMVYLKDLFAIELVQEQQLYSDFVLLEPYSLSDYYTPVLTNKYPFYNIDTVEGHHFITEYGNYYYMQDRTMILPASTSRCPDNNEIKVNIIPNIVSDSIKFNLPQNISCVGPILFAPYVNLGNLSNECFSFE